MYKRVILTLGIVCGLALLACAEAAPESEATETAAGTELADAADPCNPTALAAEAMSGTMIFAGVTLDSSTPIADILAAPDDYVGNAVRIEGTIVEVCSSQGCYVTLQDPDGNKLNLKVVDGELDFRELVETGQYAVGEGVFMTEGEHGAQLDIMEAGAMVGSTVCEF